MIRILPSNIVEFEPIELPEYENFQNGDWIAYIDPLLRIVYPKRSELKWCKYRCNYIIGIIVITKFN